MAEKKTTITRAEYLQLLGLQALGHKHAKAIYEVESAVNEILGLAKDDLDVSDLMFDDNRTVEWLMGRAGVKLEEG